MSMSAPAVGVTLQLADGVELPDDAEPERWIGAALSAAGYDRPQARLSLRVTNRDESQRMNASYRGKDRPTNVLAFPAPRLPGLPREQNNELGDLVICWSVLLAEAEVQRKAPVAHLAHLVVHGSLHLLGYDHESTAAAREMEMIEIDVLAEFGFANPYGLEPDTQA